MAQSASDGDSEPEESSALNRQTALFALKLISRLLAGTHPAEFGPVSHALSMGGSEGPLWCALFSYLFRLSRAFSLLGHCIVVLVPVDGYKWLYWCECN